MATVPRPQSSLEGAHPMRSTARVLSAAALASAVVGFAASAALADPAAEVSPTTGSPGGSVTVSVTCESAGGPAPATLEATSQAFEDGTVQLQRVPGGDEETATVGAVYRGTARLAAADTLTADATDATTEDSPWTVDGTCPPAAAGGQGKPFSASFHVHRGDGAGGAGDVRPGGDGAGVTPPGGQGGGGTRPGGDGGDGAGDTPPGDEDGVVTPPGDDSEAGTRPGGDGQGVTRPGNDGQGVTRPGGDGDPCRADSADSCDAAAVEHGVRAGEGGSFGDSVPALVAGGILIAGALGAAAYRLWRRDTATGR
jgi:hypothetical protein